MKLKLPKQCGLPGIREFILFITMAALITFDQLSKHLIEANFTLHDRVNIIPKILNFTLVYNEGAAFGMLSDHRYVFMSVTCVVVAVGILLLASRYFKSSFVAVSVTFIVAGGIGNLIDRFATGKVVDFLEFDFIEFSVFNLADCCVVVGAFMILGYSVYDIYRQTALENKKQAEPDEPPESGEPHDK